MSDNPRDPRSIPILPAWLPLLIIALTVVLLFYRLLIGDVPFWGLPSLQFEPWRTFALNELRAGRLPLWNPLNGAGAPLIANYQSALFYPPNTIGLLIALLTGIGDAHVLGWLGILHVFWAGVGMWLYLGGLRLPTFARGVGALAFAFNGALISRFGTPPMVDVAAWLPWLMWAADRVIAEQRSRNIALLAGVVAMQLLAGHAQWTFYSFVLAGAYALWRIGIARDKSTFRNRISTLLALSIGVGLGVGLVAIQLAPTAELQAQSQRASGVEVNFALNFSYQWPSLLTQINPFFFGNPGDGTYVIGGEYFETASYIGVLPLTLAVLITLHAIRWRSRLLSTPALRLIPFFAVVTLGAFVLALGRNSPIFLFLFNHVPTFNLFQAPARWLLLAVFSLSVRAAFGAALWKSDRRSTQRARLTLVAGFAIALIGGGAAWSAYHSATHTEAASMSATLFNGVFVIGVQVIMVAVAFLTQPAEHAARARLQRWQIGVLLFVAADMLWANALSNPTIAARFYDPRPPVSTARLFWTDDALSLTEFSRFLTPKDYQVAGLHQAEYRAAGLPNMNLLDGQPLFNTFEPLRPAWIDRFTQLLNDQPAPNLFAAAAIPQADQSNPRVWLVPNVVVTAEPFAAMRDPAWQPHQMAFIENAAGSTVSPLSGSFSGSESVHIVGETPLSLTLSAQSSLPSALIVADTWYPGWTATLDDVPTPIYRANGAFRAVILPAGRHTITMRYTPRTIQIGALISFIAGLVWIGLVVGGLARRP